MSESSSSGRPFRHLRATRDAGGRGHAGGRRLGDDGAQGEERHYRVVVGQPKDHKGKNATFTTMYIKVVLKISQALKYILVLGGHV